MMYALKKKVDGNGICSRVCSGFGAVSAPTVYFCLLTLLYKVGKISPPPGQPNQQITIQTFFLSFVDRSSLYNPFHMKPTRCTVHRSIFISTYLHVWGQLCAHHQENLLYLCDNGIFHSVWVAVWSAAADQTATHTE